MPPKKGLSIVNRRKLLASAAGSCAAAAWFVDMPRGLQASGNDTADPSESSTFRSIRECGVRPENSPKDNRDHLQAAIDWASVRGAALLVEPSSEPYRIASGLTLRQNVSLVGVHGPVGRGTRHPERPQPVGSVLAVDDSEAPLFTVEGATQLRGLQFWYPQQTRTDPRKIIEYPPTIRASGSRPAQGVTLSSLTFYGEFTAMDFVSSRRVCCEQVLVEHCYGYPLSGQFVRIDHCYDIPRCCIVT